MLGLHICLFKPLFCPLLAVRPPSHLHIYPFVATPFMVALLVSDVYGRTPSAFHRSDAGYVPFQSKEAEQTPVAYQVFQAAKANQPIAPGPADAVLPGLLTAYQEPSNAESSSAHIQLQQAGMEGTEDTEGQGQLDSIYRRWKC